MLIVALLLLALGTLLAATFFGTVGYHTLVSQREIDRERAAAHSDAGINRALWEIKQNADWAGIGETALGSGSYEVTIASSALERKVDAFGYVPNKTSPKAKRHIRMVITSSPGADPFPRAVHTGTGGFELYTNAKVSGDVYSNGNITCSAGGVITGDGSAVGTVTPDSCVQGALQEGAPLRALPEFDPDFWKNAANQNPSPGCPATSSVEYNGGDNTLGPCQINGSLTLNLSAKLTMKGPIYVTGNFAMNAESQLFIDDSFGKQGTVLLVDGTIRLNANSKVKRVHKTAVIRPNADYTAEWDLTGATNHWDALDEAVAQPSAGDTADYISSNNNGETDEFDMTSPSDVASTTEIVVWAYARNTASTNGDKLGINLVVGGTPQTQIDVIPTNSFGWVNATFSVALSQSQLDGLRVRLVEVRRGGQDTVEVATLYATVRYTLSGGGFIMLVSATSTDPAIELNSQADGGVFYALNDTVTVNENARPIALTGQKVVINSDAQVFYDEGLVTQALVATSTGGWSLKRGSWRIIE